MSITVLERTKEPPGRYHWTVEAFYRAIAAGVFDEPKRIEVIHGDLLEKEQVNPPHAIVTIRIMRMFRRLFEPEFCVREEKPIRIAFDGEPIPDMAVVNGTDEDYAHNHPTPDDVQLLVEVADSTEGYDTGDKAWLYAQAGIVDYWVALVRKRQIWVYRNPTIEGYPEPLKLGENDRIAPLCAPDVVIPIRDLLYWGPLPVNDAGDGPGNTSRDEVIR